MGRGAKIFLISALISACVFGLISFVIVAAVKDAAPNALPSMSGEVRTAVGNDGDSFNLLCLVTDNDGRPLSCVMLRADRERLEYTFTPVCIKTVIGKGDLMGRYYSDGLSGVISGVEELTGIKLDRYALISVEQAQSCIETLGNVTFTFTADMRPNGEFLESGTRELTARDVHLLLRYDCANSTREENASDILRAVCERLSESDGDRCYASIVNKISTDFTYDMFAVRSELIGAYPQLKKTELALCGEYKGEGDGRYFIPDTEKNLDLFSNYRKYYN